MSSAGVQVGFPLRWVMVDTPRRAAVDVSDAALTAVLGEGTARRLRSW